MVSIPINEGTVTLNHEWPFERHAEAYQRGEPVVSLEVDTDLGTAVVGLTLVQLTELYMKLDDFYTYYRSVGAGAS